MPPRPHAARAPPLPGRSSDYDPLVIRPPPNESPHAREQRLRAEAEARARSEKIDSILREQERREQRKKVVKVLLLGQSESGKSTTLKQFQILHDRRAFDQDRMAWRFVIYLNLVRSIRRILEAITPEDDAPEDESTETASIIIAGPTSAPLSSSSSAAAATSPLAGAPPAFEGYRRRLQALFPLEQRLVQLLSDPQDNDLREATRLPTAAAAFADGPVPLAASASSPPTFHASGSAGDGAGAGAAGYAGGGLPQSAPGRSAPRITIPGAQSQSSPTSPTSPGGELSVRVGSNWKKALGIERIRSPRTPGAGSGGGAGGGGGGGGGEIAGWWTDPEDPVHVVCACARAMTELWNDQGVRRRLAGKGVRLEDNGGFYLDELRRVTQKMYIPTDEDVLKARLKTTGVTEHTFRMPKSNEFRGFDWKIFDVGGSRSQRQAWAPYFDDVNAIIFLVPISAFDQMLAEDPRINRLEDSLNLWNSVLCNKLLADVTIVMFLNKFDLLKKKLESGVRLKDHLTNYTGPNDADQVAKFLRNKFIHSHQTLSPKKDRQLSVHVTSVTDTRTTRQLISDVRDAILTANLRASSLM